MDFEKSLLDRIARVRLLAFDVDGVLTDGGLYHNGERETKRFHVHDGAGISVARRAGFVIVWISGRESDAVRKRAEELKVAELHLNVKNKIELLKQIGERLGIEAAEMMFMGDDLPDLCVFKYVGLAVAPGDATADARRYAHHVCRANGGNGAVREIIEMILRNQGKWQSFVDEFIESGEKVDQ